MQRFPQDGRSFKAKEVDSGPSARLIVHCSNRTKKALMKVSLCFTADDLGITSARTHGILHAIEHGVVNRTSIMTNGKPRIHPPTHFCQWIFWAMVHLLRVACLLRFAVVHAAIGQLVSNRRGLCCPVASYDWFS